MTSRATPIQVLIADDHGVVREGLVAMVSQQPDMEVVGQTGLGVEVVHLWQEKRPHVTLLDLQLGGISGIEVVKAIREIDPQACVLILTTYDLEEDIYRCIKAGARGYLLKEVSRLELLDAIRRVHRGEKVLTGVVATKLADRLSNESLTSREIEVIEQVAAGKANKEIAEILGISEGTVKVHLKSAFARLGVLSRTEAVKVAQQRGLLRH